MARPIPLLVGECGVHVPGGGVEDAGEGQHVRHPTGVRRQRLPRQLHKELLLPPGRKGNTGHAGDDDDRVIMLVGVGASMTFLR
jgi:hypothetical protein